METAAGIQEGWDKACAYCSIAQAQAKFGNTVPSKHAIDLAKQAAAVIEEASVKAWACREIAEAQARTGDFVGGMATAAAMGDRQEKAWAYISIAEAQAKVGDMAAFREALELALSAALTTIDSPSLLAGLYADIAAAQAQAGDFVGAVRTVAYIEDAAGRLSRRWHILELPAPAGIEDAGAKAKARAYVAVYLSLAQTQAKAGNAAASREAFERAKEFAAANPDASDGARAYAAIVSAQAHAGDFTAAMDTVAAVEHGWAKVYGYWYIAHAQLKAGNTESFEQAVALGQQAEAEIQEATSQVETCSGTEAAQTEADDSASEAATPPSIDNPLYKAWAYEEMAAAWAEADELENLRSWVKTLTEPREVVSACLGAVKGLQGEEYESGE
jgi:tetratricopeptide (TPR) repeat protein